MSPKNKKKLNIQRKKLDNLDNKLLNIIKIRTNIIKKVILLKSNKNEIVDKRRIAFILRKIKKLSIKKKIDPTLTKKIWKNMIWSYIDFENSYLLCGGSFFSTNISCLRVDGLYFLAFNLTLAFSPAVGFLT